MTIYMIKVDLPDTHEPVCDGMRAPTAGEQYIGKCGTICTAFLDGDHTTPRIIVRKIKKWRDVTEVDRLHPKPECAEWADRPRRHWRATLGGQTWEEVLDYRVPADWQPTLDPKAEDGGFAGIGAGAIKISGATPPHLQPTKTDDGECEHDWVKSTQCRHSHCAKCGRCASLSGCDLAEEQGGARE